MATRDYKTRERTKPNRGRRRCSGFFWFVTGAVFGAFGVALAWTLKERTPPSASPRPQTQAEPPTKPSFVYHQLLPEMEVLVPDKELGAASPPPKKRVPPPSRKKESSTQTQPASQQASKPDDTSSTGSSYLIQVASFRTASDAEQLKAKLALLGVRAQIQQVKVNGKSYHRVRAGPYGNKQTVNKARALLSSKGLETMTIKLK
jgi:cell division protein FtsN